MKTFLRLSLVLALGLAGTACTKSPGAGEARAPEASAARSPTGTAHAPAGAKAGSYEDWCDEHQVPESLCTRCNPSLAAAFKATNDWCPEHGLPESQCRLCNPNLKIERPPRAGAK